MKRLEEIERLGTEELERIADDAGIKVPENLGAKVENSLTAARLAERPRSRKVWRMTLAPATMVLAVTLLLGIRYGRMNAAPADTFDNAEEAYTELVKVFGFIGEKINESKSISDAAFAKANKASEVLNEFYNK